MPHCTFIDRRTETLRYPPTMKHPNVQVLESVYAAFSRGDMKSVLDACADNVTFQVQGKSPLAGKYTKANFTTDLAGKLMGLSDGTFKLEVHDILASDLHAAVLVSCKLKRGGKDHEYRGVHVWRFDHGKPLAWYDYPRDLYQYDAIWS